MIVAHEITTIAAKRDENNDNDDNDDEADDDDYGSGNCSGIYRKYSLSFILVVITLKTTRMRST